MNNKSYSEDKIKKAIVTASKFIDDKIQGKKVHVNTEDAIVDGRNSVWKYVIDSFYRLNIVSAISTCEDNTGTPLRSIFNGKYLDVDIMYGSGLYSSQQSIDITKESDIVLSRAPQVGLRRYVMIMLWLKTDFIIIPSNDECKNHFYDMCKECGVLRVVDGVLTNIK